LDQINSGGGKHVWLGPVNKIQEDVSIWLFIKQKDSLIYVCLIRSSHSDGFARMLLMIIVGKQVFTTFCGLAYHFI
jgi:hypothetical protein